MEFVKEQLTFTGGDSVMATLLLSVMGAFAEFERALLRDRQREASPWPRNELQRNSLPPVHSLIDSVLPQSLDPPSHKGAE